MLFIDMQALVNHGSGSVPMALPCIRPWRVSDECEARKPCRVSNRKDVTCVSTRARLARQSGIFHMQLALQGTRGVGARPDTAKYSLLDPWCPGLALCLKAVPSPLTDCGRASSCAAADFSPWVSLVAVVVACGDKLQVSVVASGSAPALQPGHNAV